MKLLKLVLLLQTAAEMSTTSKHSLASQISSQIHGYDDAAEESGQSWTYSITAGVSPAPRYLRLGGQTVDLNTLFRVPQQEPERLMDSKGALWRDMEPPKDLDKKEGRIESVRFIENVGDKDDRRRETLNGLAFGKELFKHSNRLHEHRHVFAHHKEHEHAHEHGHDRVYEHLRRHGPHFEDGEGNSSVTVQAGHTALLDCKVRMLRDKTVSWLRRFPGEAPRLLTVGASTYAGDARLDVHFRYPGNWRLRLRAATAQDQGLYECQLNTHPPSATRVYLHVEAPEVRIVDEGGRPLVEQHYEAGSSLALRCLARGRGTRVLWLHGQRALHADVLRGGVSVRTQPAQPGALHSTLRLSRLTDSDKGNYTCRLDVPGTPSPQHSHSVLVHVLSESPAELQVSISSAVEPQGLLVLLTAACLSIR